MITEKKVANAYHRGIIKLDIDPNMESGTIARIGDYWFYFGGITAEKMNPDEYKSNIPETDIIKEIFDVLEEFLTENPDEYAYYDSILTSKNSNWSEIRCDYIDEEDHFWRVDAWLSDNDNEEGVVIAYIDDITGRVLYTDPLAQVDIYAQEIIQTKLNELKGILKIKPESTHITVSIPSYHGRLIADFEPNEIAGSGYDAIYLGLQASDNPYVYIDLAAIKSDKNKNTIDILTWQDINDEDYTERSSITGNEIDKLIKSID